MPPLMKAGIFVFRSFALAFPQSSAQIVTLLMKTSFCSYTQVLATTYFLLSLFSIYCALFSCSVMFDSLRPHGLQPARFLCAWGFSRPEYWSGLPCPPPGDLPNSGIKSRFPAWQADSFPSEPPGKPLALIIT